MHGSIPRPLLLLSRFSISTFIFGISTPLLLIFLIIYVWSVPPPLSIVQEKNHLVQKTKGVTSLHHQHNTLASSFLYIALLRLSINPKAQEERNAPSIQKQSLHHKRKDPNRTSLEDEQNSSNGMSKTVHRVRRSQGEVTLKNPLWSAIENTQRSCTQHTKNLDASNKIENAYCVQNTPCFLWTPSFTIKTMPTPLRNSVIFLSTDRQSRPNSSYPHWHCLHRQRYQQ